MSAPAEPEEASGPAVAEDEVAAASFDTGPEPEPEQPLVQLPEPRPHPLSSVPIPLLASEPVVTAEPVPVPPSRSSLLDLAARRMAEAPEASAALALLIVGGLGAVVVLLALTTVALAVSYPEPTGPPVVVVTGPTRVGLVHDTGAQGLSQRALPSIAGDSLPGVPDGGRVQVQCAQAGQLVTDVGGGVLRSSAVWLRTAQGRFASSLYVDLGDPPSLANCVPGQADLSLVPERSPG